MNFTVYTFYIKLFKNNNIIEETTYEIPQGKNKNNNQKKRAIYINIYGTVKYHWWAGVGGREGKWNTKFLGQCNYSVR